MLVGTSSEQLPARHGGGKDEPTPKTLRSLHDVVFNHSWCLLLVGPELSTGVSATVYRLTHGERWARRTTSTAQRQLRQPAAASSTALTPPFFCISFKQQGFVSFPSSSRRFIRSPNPSFPRRIMRALAFVCCLCACALRLESLTELLKKPASQTHDEPLFV